MGQKSPEGIVIGRIETEKPCTTQEKEQRDEESHIERYVGFVYLHMGIS